MDFPLKTIQRTWGIPMTMETPISNSGKLMVRSSSYGGKDQGRHSAYDVWPVSWIFFTRTMFFAAGNLTKPTCQLIFLNGIKPSTMGDFY